ncbi:L,D-transpeptidase catalytic domain [Kaistia soli DSM 19436]|uniref:L,D-transpeptidase catalytic domain n=1 Tax=Kaistia soli DSM 19436 TaxID=1122133 RepID=A0A1M4UNK2_9HYPH|nr:L,D-transpeptidase catalytic domain [Kaistia soli DSM 19436]
MLSVTAGSHAWAGEVMTFDSAGAAPGTIIVHTEERRLYLVVSRGVAVRYAVGVGRAGRQWQGTSTISGKYLKPNWEPPSDVRRDSPQLPEIIPSGSPQNPMGAAAMTIAGGLYAIHGTNKPESIGKFVSYGCIRMFNEDILDVFSRVNVGTTVIVVP